MGGHNCLYYESKENLLELVAYFFEQGFRANESCMWIVPQSLGVEGAKAVLGERIKDLNIYIEKGRLELLSCEDSYLRSGIFSPDEILELVAKKEQDVLKQGYSGLRLSGDVSWLQEKDWDKWVAYEKALDKIIPDKKITALCTFPVEKFDIGKLFTLSCSHGVTIRTKNGATDILTNRDVISFGHGK